MSFLGPVANAAQGGHASPVFYLAVGFAILGATWAGYFRRENWKRMNLWVVIEITAICAVFIFSGFSEIFSQP